MHEQAPKLQYHWLFTLGGQKAVGQWWYIFLALIDYSDSWWTKLDITRPLTHSPFLSWQEVTQTLPWSDWKFKLSVLFILALIDHSVESRFQFNASLKTFGLLYLKIFLCSSSTRFKRRHRPKNYFCLSITWNLLLLHFFFQIFIYFFKLLSYSA